MSSNRPLKELLSFAPSIKTSDIEDLEVPFRLILEPFVRDPSACAAPDATLKLQALLDYMHEKVNIGDWKDVSLCYRETITIASYFKLLALAAKSKLDRKDFCVEGLKIIDHGLLFGCPLKINDQLLQKCAEVLTNVYGNIVQNEKIPMTLSNDASPHSYETNIDILKKPSMEYFYSNYIMPQKPAILKDCISHWPALSKWQDINYIIKVGGPRTVPIELGSKYTDQEWTQKLMTIEDFIKHYIVENVDTKGYLAQYQLFQHLPQLKEDIIEPEYCCFTDTDEGIDINAWFGPKGTISPLHFDPKRNLLAQVVGHKRIILFSPEDSLNLYPHPDEMLFNTARVDPTQPDLDLYPLFASAKPYHCLLSEGDLLYIPPKWWHYVESLSVSFSVSFWWT